MKTVYKRIKGRNYILFYDMERRGAQTEMVRRNRIPGLASFYEEWENNCWYCGYDITGLQPLPRILEFCPLDRRQLEGLITELAELLRRLEPFLLDWKGIVLRPEALYRSHGGQYRFFFCEGQEGSLEEHIRELLVWLLEQSGEEDKESESLLIRLFRACGREPVRPEKLLSCLAAREPEWTVGPAPEQPETARGSGERILDKCRKWFRRKPVEMWDDLEPERSGGRPEEHGSGLSDGLGSRYPPPRPAGQDTSLTEVIFEEEAEESVPYLYCCERKEKIFLTEFPFRIGAGKEAHYNPEQRGISRLHLELDCENGRYWATDLNSTNGSSLNGRPLAPNEKKEIFSGDRLQLAGITCEFRRFDRQMES